MFTWGAFREQIRRSLLKDTVAASYRWSDGELADFCGWALDALCSHTAVATATGYTPATATVYTLPGNVYDDIEIAGEVYTTDGTTVTYLDPIRYTERLDRNARDGYSVWPEGTLNLVRAPSGTNTTLTVRYFAYYNHPVADGDSLDLVPSKLRSALGYLVAAHAMSNLSVRAANIRQWGQKPDTGNPEDNPLLKQQKHFIEMYQWELRQHPPQDRPNFFREARR